MYRVVISGGGLREAGYPNAPQSKMLEGKTVVLPPRFYQSASVSSRHRIMFANRCCESLSYLVLTLAAQNGAGLSKVDLTAIEGR